MWDGLDLLWCCVLVVVLGDKGELRASMKYERVGRVDGGCSWCVMRSGEEVVDARLGVELGCGGVGSCLL